MPIAGAGRNYRIERGQDCIVLVLFHIRMSLIAMPNNSPEPTPIGHRSHSLWVSGSREPLIRGGSVRVR